MGLGMFAITALRKASQSNAVEISTKPLANNIGDNAKISRNTRKYRKYGLMQKYVGICGPHFFSRVDQKIYSRIWLRGRKTICENMRKIRGTMRKYANNPPLRDTSPISDTSGPVSARGWGWYEMMGITPAHHPKGTMWGRVGKKGEIS